MTALAMLLIVCVGGGRGGVRAVMVNESGFCVCVGVCVRISQDRRKSGGQVY